MAQPLTTSLRARWGIPLVLPHVILSVGLLTFSALTERLASSGSVAAVPEIASAIGAVLPRQTGRS